MSVPGYLGIDLGTSAVKVLFQDEGGKVRAKARVPYETRAPQPNWAEQSPRDWWRATGDAVRKVLASLGGEADVRGIGLSGQLNGFVLLDRDREPLHDAVIWLDLRSADTCARLGETVGARVAELTGNPLSPIAVMSKLAWFAENEPKLMQRVHRIALVKDYILMRLTGELATDPSDGCCSALMGIDSGAWEADLCEHAGVSPSQLPRVAPSAAIAGRVRPQVAAELGLPAETPVVTGAGDVAALAVGCGIVAGGRAAVTLGTAGHVVLDATERPSPDPGAVWLLPHAIPDRRLWLGLVMSGGLSLSWGRGVLAAGVGDDYAALEDLARSAPPGAGGVTFLPFLEGASTPYHRPDARASFHGMSSTHGPAHMLRAVLEGVAFNVRQCVEVFEANGGAVEHVRLAEGGARMPLWCQIIADVLGRPVRLLVESDTSAAGAALLARAGAEGAPVAELAERLVETGRVFEPEEEAVSATDEAFRRYVAICEQTLRAPAS